MESPKSNSTSPILKSEDGASLFLEVYIKKETNKNIDTRCIGWTESGVTSTRLKSPPSPPECKVIFCRGIKKTEQSKATVQSILNNSSCSKCSERTRGNQHKWDKINTGVWVTFIPDPFAVASTHWSWSCLHEMKLFNNVEDDRAQRLGCQCM